MQLHCNNRILNRETGFFVIQSIRPFDNCLILQESFSLIYGFIYFLSIPSMYMLLTIYAITNLNDVSWGTRESEILTTNAKDKQTIGNTMLTEWL